MSQTAEAVDLTPGSDAWSKLMSGSKVAAVLGASPWGSPLSTWYEMKGLVPRDGEDEATEVQKRGHYLEPAILAWWRDRHPDLLEYDEQVTVHFEDWAIATLDAKALTGDFEVIGVEAKSTAKWDEWGRDGSDVIPRYYQLQVWWQFICDRRLERIYVPAFGPYLDFREYVIERPTEADLNAMLAAVRAFQASLAQDTPPPLDSHKSTLTTLSKLNKGIVEGEIATVSEDDAREYVLAALAFKEAEDRERAARSVIMAQVGKAHFIETEIPSDDGGEPSKLRFARRQARGEGLPYLVRMAKKWPGV